VENFSALHKSQDVLRTFKNISEHSREVRYFQKIKTLKASRCSSQYWYSI